MHNPLLILTCLIPLLYCSCKKGKNESKIQVCAGCVPFQKPPGIYTYPLKPGTPGWDALSNHDQKLAASQIPKATLDKMETRALLESCLEFPLLGDILLNVGVYIPGITKYYTENFSGLIELSKRTDAGEIIYDRYSSLSPSCINSINEDFSSNFSAFETIIGENNMSAVFSNDLMKKIAKEAIVKYYCKKKYPDNYAYYSFSSSVYVMAKMMFNTKYAPFMREFNSNLTVQIFVNKLIWPDNKRDTDSLFEIIINISNQFTQ